MGEKKIIKICSAIIGISGLVILFSTIYPIAAYEWEADSKYSTLISPLVEEEKGPSLKDIDLTYASNWFPTGAKKEAFAPDKVTYYTITIPKLGIHDATVAIGGEDLSQSLIQYPETALPGKTGNTVIFGHSILPQFFNPENYLSIFSTLNRAEKGDEININYDGIAYKFRIENIFEVRPSDIQILEQDTSDSFLSLVTCSPPGHPLKPKRLIVRARIVTPEQANANTGY